MPRATRKFYVELLETQGLTVEELTSSLSRLAGHLTSGRAPLEGGTIRNSQGIGIGTYGWRNMPRAPTPVNSDHGDSKD